MKELLENQLRLPRRIKLKCPHLAKWVTFACKADYKLYFPSSFQTQEYCNQKEHKRCPFYLKVHHYEYVKGIYSQNFS
jgi:hypothetical protein